jgi:hypothetical protein
MPSTAHFVLKETFKQAQEHLCAASVCLVNIKQDSVQEPANFAAKEHISPDGVIRTAPSVSLAHTKQVQA